MRGPAREPGDLDFVVNPHTIAATDAEAARMLDGIVVAVRDFPGAGLHAGGLEPIRDAVTKISPPSVQIELGSLGDRLSPHVETRGRHGCALVRACPALA
jgi:hypothetical protein